jgi:hypothetical protein
MHRHHYYYIKILIHVLVVCVKAKFIIDQENQILFRLLDTFLFFYILNFIYCPRKTRNPSPFFLCLLLLANENTDESIVPE